MEKDPCAVNKIRNYKPDVLEPYTESVYSFEEKKNKTKFVIKYVPERKTATVQCIEYWKESEKQTARLLHIEGSWLLDTVEIEIVILGTAKGERLCSHAVGYMVKVLLIEAEKVHEFPTYGTVLSHPRIFVQQ